MEVLLKQYLVKNRLRFSEELETLFDEDYFHKTVPIARFALVLAFVLYAAFGILDLYISPMTKSITWFIRYAVICPLILLVFVLSFFKFFKMIMQHSVFVLSLAMGFGIIVMIMTARSDIGGLFYYAGLILVIVWSYTLVRLKFINATIVGWIIVAAYECAAVFYQDLWKSDRLINAFINNNFFFISANIIGMFASYHMEMYTRRDFLQRCMIIEDQKKIEQEKNTLAIFHKNMTAELDMARSIQQQIIPRGKPAPYISALFKPMEPIGGDFYDFIKFREPDTIGIFLSDVSGHGVPAALITTMIKSIITEAGISKLDPAQMLTQLNTTLGRQMAGNYATAFYGIYSKAGKTITYSSAGHNPPYLIHRGALMSLDKAGSRPLGVITDYEIQHDGLTANYINHVQDLPAPSKIVFYTDGLTEAKNENRNPRMFIKLIDDIMLKLAHLPCDEFIAELYGELVRFRGNETFDDDVCIICLDVG